MTEQEAIELLRSMQNPKQDYADVVCAPAFCTGFRFVYPEPEDYAIEEAIKALEEVRQYREIGTVEECREAVEKQKPKKPRLNYKPKFFGKATYTCPRCGNCRLEEFANERQNNNYCWDCGQAIRWGENLEGMEDEEKAYW